MQNEQQETPEIRQRRAGAIPDGENSPTDVAARDASSPSGFQRFRRLLDQVRTTQQPVSRRELSRDKSKSLFLLIGVSVALLLVFFGVFSTPKSRIPLPGEVARGMPSLGRKLTPGQEQNDPNKALTPLLSADVRDSENNSGSEVTPQDVGGTSPRYDRLRGSPTANSPYPEKPTPGRVPNPEPYALRNVDFSDPVQPSRAAPVPTPPSPDSILDLKKPSIVFVRAKQAIRPALQNSPDEENPLIALLPAGTRLVARLEAPVSSAVPAPVIAVVEYNYERNGEIVLPAGTKVFGKLSRVSPSGFVGIQFDRVQLPDGSEQKLDATAMNLRFGPLKGNVSGRYRGRNFLVRSMTGIGTVAAYVVGGHGAAGFNEPISENSLMRERFAENIGTAGQAEINSMSANQTLIVTVPGNTRFYIVVEKSNSDHLAKPSLRSLDWSDGQFSNGKIPSLEELRDLIQLKSELNQMYLETNSQTPVQPEK